MPEVRISYDETYPDFFLTERSGYAVKIDQATLDRWRRVLDEYDAVQKEMRHFSDNGLWKTK